MNGDHMGPFNIGNPKEFTMLELAKVVQEVVDPKAQIVYRENTADDPTRRRPDISKVCPCRPCDSGLGSGPLCLAERGSAGVRKWWNELLLLELASCAMDPSVLADMLTASQAVPLLLCSRPERCLLPADCQPELSMKGSVTASASSRLCRPARCSRTWQLGPSPLSLQKSCSCSYLAGPVCCQLGAYACPQPHKLRGKKQCSQ